MPLVVRITLAPDFKTFSIRFFVISASLWHVSIQKTLQKSEKCNKMHKSEITCYCTPISPAPIMDFRLQHILVKDNISSYKTWTKLSIMLQKLTQDSKRRDQLHSLLTNFLQLLKLESPFAFLSAADWHPSMLCKLGPHTWAFLGSSTSDQSITIQKITLFCTLSMSLENVDCLCITPTTMISNQKIKLVSLKANNAQCRRFNRTHLDRVLYFPLVIRGFHS